MILQRTFADLGITINQHSTLADAIAANEPTRAETLMIADLQRILRHLGEARDRFPGYFQTDQTSRKGLR